MSCDRPLVSIVTPVLNGARYLPELLASIQQQDYPHIEHVIVDGGSQDGTLEILRRAERVRWTSDRDIGMYDGINRGLRLSRGEVLAYQNSDDRYVVPDSVSSAIRELERDPNVDAVYGDFVYIDDAGQRIGHEPPGGREFSYTVLKRYNFVPAHSLFVRRRCVFDQGNWFDPELQFSGDWDWVLGLGRAGVRFRHFPMVLSEFRLHGNSKTRLTSLRSKVVEWRRVCRKHGASLMLLLFYELFYAPQMRRLGRLP